MKSRTILGALGVGAVCAGSASIAEGQAPAPPAYAANYAGGSTTTTFSGANGGYQSPKTSYVRIAAGPAATSGRVRVEAYGFMKCGGQGRFIHTTQMVSLASGDATTPRTMRFTRNYLVGQLDRPRGYRLKGSLKFGGTLQADGGSGTITLTGKARRSGQRTYKSCSPTVVHWEARPTNPITDLTPVTGLDADRFLYGGGTQASALPDTLILKTRRDGSGILFGAATVPMECDDGDTFYEPWLFPGADIKPDGSMFLTKTFPQLGERIELRLHATASGIYGTMRAVLKYDGGTCDSGELPVVVRR
jgi:hypothetical protein